MEVDALRKASSKACTHSRTYARARARMHACTHAVTVSSGECRGRAVPNRRVLRTREHDMTRRNTPRHATTCHDIASHGTARLDKTQRNAAQCTKRYTKRLDAKRKELHAGAHTHTHVHACMRWHATSHGTTRQRHDKQCTTRHDMSGHDMTRDCTARHGNGTTRHVPCCAVSCGAVSCRARPA